MKLKLALSTATALGLVFSVAAHAADDNEVVLQQDGYDNSQVVDQSGDDNKAGSSDRNMTQLGYNNKLNVLQSGDYNEIGLEGNGVYQENWDDSDVSFEIDITQSSDGNVIGSVEQIAAGDAGSGVRNSATITQSGSLNILGVDLGWNRVGSVYQERKSSGSNVLTIEQNGVADRLETVYQRSNIGGNAPNRIAVTMSGDGDLSGGNGWGPSLTGFAAASGAESSALKQGNLVQKSRGNSIDLNVSGTFNNFGVTQNGEGNTVGTLNVGGTFNQLGVQQNGTSNEVAVADVNGGGNNIGISQNGVSNFGDVVVSGDFNQLGVTQVGTDNDADVSITGDSNGGGTLDGAAGLLAAANSLESGQIVQDGLRNYASLTITGDGNNEFAYLQDGNDNDIVGTVSGAGSNSATMVQIGNHNSSTFTQMGGGNMVSVNQ